MYLRVRCVVRGQLSYREDTGYTDHGRSVMHRLVKFDVGGRQVVAAVNDWNDCHALGDG